MNTIEILDMEGGGSQSAFGWRIGLNLDDCHSTGPIPGVFLPIPTMKSRRLIPVLCAIIESFSMIRRFRRKVL